MKFSQNDFFPGCIIIKTVVNIINNNKQLFTRTEFKEAKVRNKYSTST